MNEAHLERGRQRGHWAGLHSPPVLKVSRADGADVSWRMPTAVPRVTTPQTEWRHVGTTCPIFVMKVNEATGGSPHAHSETKGFLMENYYFVTVLSFRQYFDGEQCRLMVCSLNLVGFWWGWWLCYTAADLLFLERICKPGSNAHVTFISKIKAFWWYPCGVKGVKTNKKSFKWFIPICDVRQAININILILGLQY